METIVTNGVMTSVPNITNAPVLDVADAPTSESLPEFLRGISEDVNAGPLAPGALKTEHVVVKTKAGKVTSTFDLAYSTGATTVDVPAHLYHEDAGKAVVSANTNAFDDMLTRLSLVRGGTKAYIPLPWTRDDVGFKRIDRKLVTHVRKAAERLAILDRASHHRFDYARFTVMPASDDAPSTIGGYLRIVFTGTRVK